MSFPSFYHGGAGMIPECAQVAAQPHYDDMHRCEVSPGMLCVLAAHSPHGVPMMIQQVVLEINAHKNRIYDCFCYKGRAYTAGDNAIKVNTLAED